MALGLTIESALLSTEYQEGNILILSYLYKFFNSQECNDLFNKYFTS